MGQELYTHECCPIIDHSPILNACFLDSIIKGYERLYCYGVQKFREPSPRIQELAIPKHYREPFKRTCPCVFKKTVQIVYDNPPFKLNTRSVHLALPSPRKLELRKKEIAKFLPKKRMANYNKLIRKSYYSMYSCLMNVRVPECVPPAKPDPAKKKRLRKLKKYLAYAMAKLAIPKEAIEPPEVERASKDLESLLPRIKRLAEPVWRYDYPKPEWVFTKAMHKYKASERVRQLSKPKQFEYHEPREFPMKVPLSALKYKISPRVNEIAEAKTLRKAESDLKDNPFGVSPNALKYKISKRLKEIAEPKEREDGGHIREHPELISPKALTYKATPRIIALAQPKER